MGDDTPVLRLPGDLTGDWLEQALDAGPVTGFTVEAIGTGQMSESRRVKIEYAAGPDSGPASVVLKTASEDENSRGAGVGLGVYEREVRFYRELAPRIGGPLAECHVAVIDPKDGWFTLLLEDVSPASQGDQIAGCSVEHARLAVHELARLHAPLFADSELGATPWLNQENVLGQALLTQLLPVFLERYGDQVAPEHQEVCRRFIASLDGWVADRRPPLGLVHGDYRLDNMLFGDAAAPRRFVTVDWQTVCWGPVMTDLSYFLGSSLTVEDRREHAETLVREYYDALHAHGVRGFSWEDCWRGYRRESFLGLLMTVAPAVLVERTERGDEMFMTQRRPLRAAGSGSRRARAAARARLRPPAGAAPGAGRRGQARARAGGALERELVLRRGLRGGRTGVYIRLGLYPSLGVAWVTAFVCGPAARRPR